MKRPVDDENLVPNVPRGSWNPSLWTAPEGYCRIFGKCLKHKGGTLNIAERVMKQFRKCLNNVGDNLGTFSSMS
jgi:hypothetical protein